LNLVACGSYGVPVARPITINDDEVLSAAKAVLLEHGMNATTAEVASRAGVSEGSLFRRFRSKTELFHAALMHRMSDVPDFVLNLPLRTGRGELVDELEGLAMEAIAFLRLLVPVVMMNWSNRKSGLPLELDEKGEPRHARVYRSMATWLLAEQRLGRVHAKVDVELAAHLFLGGMYNWVSFEVMREVRSSDAETRAFARGCAHTMFVGLAPSKPKK
jgi:AcrR family transcriptional regulator